MASGITTVIYPVQDLAKAKPVFTALLGVEPAHDAPFYVGYELEGQHIGLDPHGHRGGAVGYRDVDDIKASLQELIDAGATLSQDVKDVGGGTLIATVEIEGNTLGLRQR